MRIMNARRLFCFLTASYSAAICSPAAYAQTSDTTSKNPAATTPVSPRPTDIPNPISPAPSIVAPPTPPPPIDIDAQIAPSVPKDQAAPPQPPASNTPASDSVETPPESPTSLGFVGDAGADPQTSIILDNADTFEEHEPGHWVGRGNVRFRYKGYKLTSDQVDVNEDTGDAVFTGNVTLIAPGGQTVKGGQDGSLQLNMRRNTYTVIGARTTVPPEQLNVGVILPIYVYGGTITGRPGLIDARGSSFTTCDYLEPHYYFKAKQLYVFPGIRLVGKNVTLYRKDRKIITLPYFVVPLDRHFSRQTLAPQVGYSQDEGYFAKFAIGYALTNVLPGLLRIDLMQKKGIGTGFEQNYGSPNLLKSGLGLLTLYHLRDKSTGLDNFTGSLRHQQQFGTIGVNLNTQFQQNSYLQGATSSSAISNQLNLTRNVGNLNSTANLNLQESDYGSGKTQTLTTALNNTFLPTSHERFQTQFNYSDFTSGVAGAMTQPQRLDSHFDYAESGRNVDLEVLATKYTQLTGGTAGTNFFGGLEQLPEVRLGTDATREPFLKSFLPSTAQLNLSLGDFNEPTSSTRGQRARFGIDLGDIVKNINNRNTFDFSGSFQQGFYSDNAAQYVINGRSGYRLKIGNQSSLNLNYNYLRPYGFSPFQFDFIGNSNNAALQLALKETRQFQLSLGTGYDFNQAHAQNGFPAQPWQNVAIQTLFTPSALFRMRTDASYSINTGLLQDLTNNFKLQSHSGFALNVGTRYAPQQHRVSYLSGNLDFPFFRDLTEDAGYRIRAIAGYNGFTNSFEYKGLALTRTWHDYEATLVYEDNPQGLRPGPSINFNFSLKAFPAYEPFAIGQFGQSLDTGVGDIY